MKHNSLSEYNLARAPAIRVCTDTTAPGEAKQKESYRAFPPEKRSVRSSVARVEGRNQKRHVDARAPPRDTPPGRERRKHEIKRKKTGTRAFDALGNHTGTWNPETRTETSQGSIRVS